jgi:hypothetical protein
MQEELAGERVKAFPVYELREELHPSVPAQYPPCSGTGNYFKRRDHEIQSQMVEDKDQKEKIWCRKCFFFRNFLVFSFL